MAKKKSKSVPKPSPRSMPAPATPQLTPSLEEGAVRPVTSDFADAAASLSPAAGQEQKQAPKQGQEKGQSGKARKAEERAQPVPTGMVQRSTLYLSVALALVLGIYAGTLLPGLMGHSMSASPAAPASSPAAASAPAPTGQPTEQEQNIARLAGHIQELEATLRKTPDDVKAWVQLGNLYFDTGKALPAINAYERALLLKPDNADVLTDLGIMYREAGKHELAVQSFRKATKLNPRHQNALFNTGVVLFYDLGRKEEARAVWRDLLKVNPKAAAPNGKPVADMLRELK